MRKFYAVLLTLILLLGLLPEKQFSQFRLKLGPQTGLNFNIGTGSDLPETSSGFGFFIGGTVDMSFSPMVGLITNLQFYDNRSNSFSESDSFEGVKFTVENSASIAYFMIEPLFKLSIPRSGFYFVMGPAVGFSVQSTGEIEITSPGDQLTFDDGSTKKSASIENMNARLELKLGAGYDINLGPLYLTPQVTFGYGITEVQEDVSARILTIQALIAVKFNLI